MKIEYIGNKPHGRNDTVANTGIVWLYKGDVQEVPDEAVPLLLKHADVWREAAPTAGPVEAGGLADAQPVTEPATEPMRVESDSTDLYNMNTAALREYAAGKGYDVDLTLKGQALRTAINLAGG